ncbi:hypothetical protein AAG570_009832 [Ranatra chinensis]|uniref:Uncharacterized protein n=1 Tax=Ranatra chinensis TaxID=642074 RepID=A0ABD0YQ84_9HEMI
MHFAAARTHSRNAFFQFLQDADANIGLRDELYRTVRDIAEQINITENVQSIDKYVVSLAARAENNKLTELMLEGYDHILDAEDDGVNIIDVSRQRENNSTVSLLSVITTFEERRDKLHRAVRFGSLGQVIDAFQAGNSKMLAIAKNQQSRCCLHIAVLMQQEKITEHIASKYKETLHVGDNLMRTALHYAMAVEKVETLAGTLINAGAQRLLKDLKGRQPSYYFMNKTDILKLQEEEEALRV